MKLGIFTGLAGLDIVYYQDNLPIENSKSKTNDYITVVGGPAANAAITYAMLGGKALLITCIGHSEFGQIIKKQLHDYGVEVIDFAKGADVLPSISGISVNKTNGNRTIWSGQPLYNKINDEKFETVMYSISMGKASFCFSDCNVPQISIKVLQEAKKHSKTIILDAGSWKDNFDFYLSVADEVIASAVCKPPTHHHDFMAAAMDYGVKNVAITDGGEAIKWKSPEEQGKIAPPKVEAKDTLGAGDIFHGAYCFFRVVKNLSFADSLEKAAEVASLSVQYWGPREGVKAYLRNL